MLAAILESEDSRRLLAPPGVSRLDVLRYFPRGIQTAALQSFRSRGSASSSPDEDAIEDEDYMDEEDEEPLATPMRNWRRNAEQGGKRSTKSALETSPYLTRRAAEGQSTRSPAENELRRAIRVCRRKRTIPFCRRSRTANSLAEGRSPSFTRPPWV